MSSIPGDVSDLDVFNAARISEIVIALSGLLVNGDDSEKSFARYLLGA